MASLVTSFYILDQFGEEPFKSLVIIVGCFGFVYFILQRVFRKLTRHRGIFHSILALSISVLSLNYLLLLLKFPTTVSLLLSLSLGIGYLGHLILDEVNSVVNLSGIPFIPNKSMGSALKIVSKSSRVNMIAFMILGILITMTYFQATP